MSQISILSGLSGDLVFEGTTRKLMKWVKKFEYDVNDFPYYYGNHEYFSNIMYDEFVKWFKENYEYEVSFINSNGEKFTISEFKKINFEYEDYVFNMIKEIRKIPNYIEWAMSFIESYELIRARRVREIRDLVHNGLLLPAYEIEVFQQNNLTMYFMEKVLQSTCEQINEDQVGTEDIVESENYIQNKKFKKKYDSIIPHIYIQKMKDTNIKRKWKKRTEERYNEYAIKYETAH